MPTNHEAYTAVEAGAGRDLLVRRIIYPFADGEDPTDFVANDPDSGIPPVGLFYQGLLFSLDPDDSTTAHDGILCIVTFDNLRYKRTVIDPPVSVLTKSFSDDDDLSPAASVGDWFIVGAAATGDWAGHTDDLAVLTSSGWQFVTPEVGVSVYVEDEDSTYHVDTNGDWIAGIGANSLEADSILPSQLKGGGQRVRFIVENQTTNSPPGTVTEGVSYVIGSSPTGAWSGHAAKIAHGENDAWVIYTPSEGWRIYDKALDSDYLFTGSAWVTGAGNMVMNRTVFTGSGTFTKDSRCVFVDVHVIGGTGGARTSGATGGGTSSFGAHCSATGSGAGDSTTPGTVGAGSGGDVNSTGVSGVIFTFDSGGIPASDGYPGFQSTAFGIFQGVKSSNTASAVSSGPGYSRKKILAASLGANETVTVGAAGASGGAGGTAGVAGMVIVDEWVLS